MKYIAVNIKTGEERIVEACTGSGAIHKLFNDIVHGENPPFDYLDFYPFYDDLHRVWFFENWEIKVTDDEHDEFIHNMRISSIKHTTMESIELVFDRCDYDGFTGDYYIHVKIDEPKLYKLILEHCPECITCRRLGDDYV